MGWDPTIPQLSPAVTALLTARCALSSKRRSLHVQDERRRALADAEKAGGAGLERLVGRWPGVFLQLAAGAAETDAEKYVKGESEGSSGGAAVDGDASIARLQCIADTVTMLVPKPGRFLMAVPRAGTETYRQLLAEVGLRGTVKQRAAGKPEEVERAAKTWFGARIKMASH